VENRFQSLPFKCNLQRYSAGCVIANDINPRRCYFLVRRCAALGAATQALMVTNHHAQWFPNSGVPLTPLDEASAAAGGGLEWPMKEPTAPPAAREALQPGGASGGAAASSSRAKGGGGGGGVGRYPEGVYDRIICDVPCSGDGTLRKNPQIWSEWRPEFAMVGLCMSNHVDP
jgi:tRNA (cytosine34-C5)-methyltransferase